LEESEPEPAAQEPEVSVASEEDGKDDAQAVAATPKTSLETKENEPKEPELDTRSAPCGCQLRHYAWCKRKLTTVRLTWGGSPAEKLPWI